MSFSKEPMLLEVDRLIDLGLFDSAETLALFYTSHLSSIEFKQGTESTALVTAELFERLGDVLYRRKEFKRAMNYFRSANDRRRSQKPNKLRPTFVTVTSKAEAILRYKECKCLVELKESALAGRELDNIPSKLRDCKMNLLLGDLLRKSNNRRSAILAYKEALASAPYAIEVIEKLVSLGVEAVEILPILDEALRGKESVATKTDGWLHTLVAGLVHKRNHEYEKSFSQFNRLANIYPQNAYLLINQASLTYDMHQESQSMTLFKQVRKLDNRLVQRMEVFGNMLYYLQDTAELSRLADEVLDACPQHPTGWLLAAMFSAAKGEADAALVFIDKAVKIDPTFAETFRFKGIVLSAQELHDQALIAFSQANRIEKDMASYNGLVATNLELGKVKEAAACAREAISCIPRSSLGYLAMGMVFSVSQPNSAECLSAYAKALQLNPLNRTACLKMAEVLTAQGKEEEAAACLVNALNRVSCPRLRLALGKAYASLGRYREAIENVHLAISLSPATETGPESDAAQELERIEQLLRGENAEEEEEEEECEEEEQEEYEGEEGEEGDMDDEMQQALALSEAQQQLNNSDSFEQHQADFSGEHDAHRSHLSGMRGHSLMDNSGASEGGGIFAYGNGALPGLYAHSGSVDSADDPDLQRALSQSLLDPYGGGNGPGEDFSGYDEEDDVMSGPTSTPRRF